jgi:predicted transcriptional regulator
VARRIPAPERRDLERKLRDARVREAEARAIFDAVHAEVRAFERAVARQDGQRVGNDKSDPAKNAGNVNVERVAAYLREHRRASQAQITRDLQMNSGTVFWAVTALKQANRIHTRGQREGRSPIWHYGRARRRA